MGTPVEYGPEILEYILLQERSVHRNPQYLLNQSEVNERMRSILIDWLVDVNIKFRLHPETFHLAVDIIDRYLSLRHCPRSRLQLVGVVAVLMAAKHEEIWPPEVRECVYIAANTYTREEILECEREIGNELQFRLALPTSYPVASYVLEAMNASPQLKNASLMFLESAAIDYQSLGFLPSVNAFAAIALASLATTPEAERSAVTAWPAMCERITRVDYATILPCAAVMLRSATALLNRNSRYQATFRKFSSSRHHEVALLPLPAVLPDPALREE
jgi:cyclin A